MPAPNRRCKRKIIGALKSKIKFVLTHAYDFAGKYFRELLDKYFKEFIFLAQDDNHSEIL